MTRIERNYVRWYLRENAKKYCLILLVLFMVAPLMSILLPGNEEFRQNFSPMTIQIYAIAILGSLLALGFALYNFRYLSNKRNATMMFGMPIKKGHMFVLQYAIGAISIFVSLFVMFGLAILLDSSTWPEMSVYWTYNFCTALLCVCLYTMYVAIIMKCNNAWDACLVCLGYTFLPFFVYLAMTQMLGMTLSTTLFSSVSSADEFFPMLFVLECLSIPTVIVRFGTMIVSNAYDILHGNVAEEGLWDLLLQENDFSFWLIVFWVVVAIILFVVAKRIYQKRGSEASEQRTTAYLCYPFLSLLLASTLIMFDVYPYNSMGSASISIPITMILVSFCIYLVMNFFARRKIQCTKGMIFSYVGVVIGVFVLQYACISTKGFYQVKEIPAFEDVASVRLNIDFELDEGKGVEMEFKNPKFESLNHQEIRMINTEGDIRDTEVIEQAYQLHENLITSFEQEYAWDHSINEQGYVSIYLSYTKADGGRISRSYTVVEKADIEKIARLSEQLVDKEHCGNAGGIMRNNGIEE